MPPGPPFPGSRGTPNVAKSAARGCVNFFPEINFGVSRYDLFLVVYKGGLFTLRPFFNPFQRYENFVFGQKKNCHISETKRFDPLKSNSLLYKPHQMSPFQERNFFFLNFFRPKKKLTLPIFRCRDSQGREDLEAKLLLLHHFLHRAKHF